MTDIFEILPALRVGTYFVGDAHLLPTDHAETRTIRETIFVAMQTDRKIQAWRQGQYNFAAASLSYAPDTDNVPVKFTGKKKEITLRPVQNAFGILGIVDQRLFQQAPQLDNALSLRLTDTTTLELKRDNPLFGTLKLTVGPTGEGKVYTASVCDQKQP